MRVSHGFVLRSSIQGADQSRGKCGQSRMRPMLKETGNLVALQVAYVRTAKYSVRYQLENRPAREVMIGPNPRTSLVADVRDSQLGESVTVTLSDDGAHMLDWVNHVTEALWKDFPGTWGETDD